LNQNIHNSFTTPDENNIVDSTQNHETNTEVGQFKRITIPLVKRVYPSLIYSNVQPFAHQHFLEDYFIEKYHQQKPKVDWKKEGF
jgi:hypothetical protein